MDLSVASIESTAHMENARRKRAEYHTGESVAERARSINGMVTHLKAVAKYAVLDEGLSEDLVQEITQLVWDITEDLCSEYHHGLDAAARKHLSDNMTIEEISALFGVSERMRKLSNRFESLLEFAVKSQELGLDVAPDLYGSPLSDSFERWVNKPRDEAEELDEQLRDQVEAKFFNGRTREEVVEDRLRDRDRCDENTEIEISLIESGRYKYAIFHSGSFGSGGVISDPWQYFLDEDIVNKVLAVPAGNISSEWGFWHGETEVVQHAE